MAPRCPPVPPQPSGSSFSPRAAFPTCCKGVPPHTAAGALPLRGLSSHHNAPVPLSLEPGVVINRRRRMQGSCMWLEMSFVLLGFWRRHHLVHVWITTSPTPRLPAPPSLQASLRPRWAPEFGLLEDFEDAIKASGTKVTSHAARVHGSQLLLLRVCGTSCSVSPLPHLPHLSPANPPLRPQGSGLFRKKTPFQIKAQCFPGIARREEPQFRVQLHRGSFMPHQESFQEVFEERAAIKHCTASRCVICHKMAQKHKMWLLQEYY